MTETDPIAEAGVNLVGFRVSHKLKWLYRPQPVSDQGIDAQIEVAEEGRGTGALLAVQIKTGESYFREPTDDGWTFRFSAKHHHLWLNHALPVVVLLVDLELEAVYWQRVHLSTVEEAGASFKLVVPRTNRIQDAAADWAHLASGNERRAEDQYLYNRTVLPPSTRKILEEHLTPVTPHSAMVAMHLAAGRGNPAGTVQALLSARPLWVTSHPWLWRAIASYASEHELYRESSEAFEAAGNAFLALASQETDQAAASFAAGGINVLSEDLDRAKALLQRADDLGAAPIVTRLGLLTHGATVNSSAVEVPHELLDSNDPKLISIELLQIVAANMYLQRGDQNEGVRRMELAVAAAPDSTRALSQLAHHLASRDHTARRQTDDLSRAESLLVRAIEQRREWAGPTTELLRELSRALALQGKVREVLYWLCAPPNGTATPLEAADPELIRETVRASYVARERVLTNQLAKMLGDDPADRLLLHRVGIIEIANDELIELLQAEARRSLENSDLQQLAAQVHALADLGIDASQLLDEPVAAGQLEPWVRDMCAGIAIARSAPNGDLAKLQAVARAAAMAAEVLILILGERGDLDAAINAATAAQQRFRNANFALKKADLLVRAGRLEEAEHAASTALVSTNQFPDSRIDLTAFLVQRACERGDWADAEAVAARAVDETDPPHARAIWILVEVQVASGHHDRAIHTLDRHAPQITEVKHARLWCRAHISLPWDDRLVEFALNLVAQFADDAGFGGQVLSHIISTTISPDELEPDPEDDSPPPPGVEPGPYQLPLISNDLRLRATEMLNMLATEHGEESGVRVVEEDDDQAMLDRIMEMTKDRAERRWTELPDLVARGRLGIGMLATYLRASYAGTLVRQAAGFQFASSASDEEHAAEVGIARAASKTAVVVDTSALVVSSLLTNGLELRALFSDLYLAPAALRDITQAEFELRANGASPGSLGWDPDAQLPVYRENSADAHRLASTRLSLLVDIAAQTISRDAPEPEGVFDELSETVRTAPWFAALRVAAVRELPVWCDDLAARRLAAALGIQAFGTPALVDSIVEDLVAQEAFDDALALAESASTEFIANGVVDVPVTTEQLMAQGRADDWHPKFGALILSRPAWWAGHDDPLPETLSVLKVAAHERPESASTWQFAAMLGASRAFVDRDLCSRVLALMALIGTTDSATAQTLLDGFRSARHVARQSGQGDPLEAVHVAQQQLQGTAFERSSELVEEMLSLLQVEEQEARE